jgi:hypothetical protein
MMTQKELADALNLTQQRVGQMVRGGMPTTSLAAAKLWRKRNIDPTRTKEGQQQARDRYRRDTEPEFRPPPAVPTGDAPGYGAHSWGGWWGEDMPIWGGDLQLCLDMVNALGRQAAQHGDAWLEPLRNAMLLVPACTWEVIDLDPIVWQKLTGNPQVLTRRRGDGPYTKAMAQRYIDACRLHAALELQSVQEHEE